MLIAWIVCLSWEKVMRVICNLLLRTAANIGWGWSHKVGINARYVQ